MRWREVLLEAERSLVAKLQILSRAKVAADAAVGYRTVVEGDGWRPAA